MSKAVDDNYEAQVITYIEANKILLDKNMALIKNFNRQNSLLRQQNALLSKELKDLKMSQHDLEKR